MEKYRTAKSLYSENKFETAVEYFKDSFNNEVLNESEKIDCLTQIIKIQKLINRKEDTIKVERELADFLIQRRDYSGASVILSKLTKSHMNYDNSVSLIETLILDGQLGKAETEINLLFKYLFKKKNFEKSQNLYSSSIKNFPKNLKFDSFYILALIASGNVEKLEDFTSENPILFEGFLGAPFNHWRHSPLYLKTIASNSLTDDDFNLNKLSIKLLLEVVLMGNEIGGDELTTYLKYFIKKERKAMSRLICNYAEDKGQELDQRTAFRIDSLPEDAEVDTDMDFAEDLLNQGTGGKSTTQNLIDNIELLENMGEQQEAEILITKLKKLDPENKRFKMPDRGSRVKIKRIEVEDLEREWNESFKADDSNKLEMMSTANASIASLSDPELLTSFRDLIYCFNSMELYGVSLKVINRIHSLYKKENITLDLEVNYLLIKTLMASQDYYKAYDLVTQINGSTPISADRRVEFLYLQGEIARKLGRKKDAIKSYLLVKSINPNYRLVRQRLQNFG